MVVTAKLISAAKGIKYPQFLFCIASQKTEIAIIPKQATTESLGLLGTCPIKRGNKIKKVVEKMATERLKARRANRKKKKIEIGMVLKNSVVKLIKWQKK